MELDKLKEMEAMRAAISSLEEVIANNLDKQSSLKSEIFGLTKLDQIIFSEIMDLKLNLEALKEGPMDVELREELFAKLKDLSDKSEDIQCKIRDAEAKTEDLKGSEFRTKSILLINKQKLQSAEHSMIAGNGQVFVQIAAMNFSDSLFEEKSKAAVKRFTSFVKNLKQTFIK